MAAMHELVAAMQEEVREKLTRNEARGCATDAAEAACSAWAVNHFIRDVCTGH